MTRPDLADLVAAARALVVPGGRRILGLTGPPGAGKSSLAAVLVAALTRDLGPGTAVLVPMDGFHLAQAELDRLGRADRKGAPDTFDAAGYVALLARLRSPRVGETVYAPRFDRSIEEPVAGAIPVPADVPLVVTEGNYLLYDGGGWASVAGLLDECWYLEVPEETRLRRLIARHLAYGRTPGQAGAWARGPDQRNADLIARNRHPADRVVPVPDLGEQHDVPGPGEQHDVPGRREPPVLPGRA